jgi:hypothetical protein
LFLHEFFQVNAFNTHDGHEEISGVSQFRADSIDTVEVVNGLASIIKVNDFAFSHEQQFIEHIKDVGVRLMDGGDHSLSLLDSQLT